MTNSGLPTPDNFEGDATFVCIPLVVPNKPEFMAAIYGLYGQMANSWFWRELGTMTPDEAARLSSLGLGATDAYGTCGDIMSCEDIADCIEEQIAIDPETNTPVNNEFYNSLFEMINNSGFGSSDHINAEMTTVNDKQPSGFASTEVKQLENCNRDKLWAGIRHGIVQRLDENASDMLQDLAALNDVPQRYQAFIDIVPVLGDVAEAIATAATEVIPDIQNQFNSYTSETILDEIACDIFAIVCSECRYPTYEELWDYYATGGFEIGEMDAMQMASMVGKLAGMISGALPSSVIYHTTIVFQLFTLYLNARYNVQSGSDALTRMATLGEDWASDNWLQLCNACDEQYQVEFFDFTQATHGFELLPQIGSGGFGGQWVAGQGFKWTNTSAGNWAVIGKQLNPMSRIRALGMNVTGNFVVASSGISLRPTIGSNTGVANQNLSNGATYNRSNCALTAAIGFNQIQMGILAGDANPAYIEKAFIVYDRSNYAPGTPTAIRTYC